MNKLTAIVTAAAIVAAPVQAKTLTVGVDVSTSNPLFTNRAFASRVAQDVKAKIATLQPGDTVVVRQLGDRSVGNAVSESIQITTRMRADKVGARVASYIADMPTHPEIAQGATNIVGFFTLGQFACASGGEVIVATDGVEYSEVMTGPALLAGMSLPPPPRALLAGCIVTMVGLGQSTDGEITLKQATHVVSAWTSWMKAAGATFTPLVNP